MKTQIALLAEKTAKLRANVSAGGGKITVDAALGVIRGAAVMSIGEANGHGFSIDMACLETVRELIAAEPDGVKMHYQHPAVGPDGNLGDQLGAIVGRLKNPRIDAAVLRGDCFLLDAAKNLPGLGDARGYLLALAESDPAIFGLSAVFLYDSEIVSDADGQPTAVVARPTKLFQVDFVGSPAANSSGLLSSQPITAPTEPADDGAQTAKSFLATVVAGIRSTMQALRDFRDGWFYAGLETQTVDLAGLCRAAGDAAQALTATTRTCIDAMNRIVPGTLVNDTLQSTAATTLQAFDVVCDEVSDAATLTGEARFGSGDMGDAAAVSHAMFRTCLATIDDARSAITPVTTEAIQNAIRWRAETDAVMPPDSDDFVAGSTMKLMAARRRGDDCGLYLMGLGQLRPAAAAHLCAKLRIPGGTAVAPAPASNLPPSRDEIRFSPNPGDVLLTWLHAVGLNARHVGEARFEIFGPREALQRHMTDEVVSLCREWAWAMAEPLGKLNAARLVGVALTTPDQTERERLAIAALSCDAESATARQLFTDGASMSLSEAMKKTHYRQVYEFAPEVGDDLGILSL